MTNKDNSSNKNTRRNIRQKVTILSLSIALALTGAAAVTVPLVVKKTGGGGGGETVFYTVTFDTDGGSTVDTQQVAKGKKATEPKSPTKTKKDFGGWYTDKTYSTPFDFSQAINANVKVYAKWVDQQVTTITVVYDAGSNGYFGTPGTTTTSLAVEKGQKFKNVFKPSVTVVGEYAHIGWTNSKGEEIDPETDINDDISIKAKYQANPAKETITLSDQAGDSSWDVTIKGQTSYTLLKSEYTTYGQIMDSLPVATCEEVEGMIPSFAYWSKDEQISTDPSEMPEAIQEGDPIGANDTLYPVFNFTDPESTVTLNVVLINDRYHTQTLSKGSLSIDVNAKAQGKTTNKKFKELNKPDIYEYNKAFAGYYHSYNNGVFSDPWDNDQEIYDGYSNTNIYIKMDEVITDPIITFELDPEMKAAGHTIQWVGNTSVKVSSGTKLSAVSVPNAYLDATENPDPSIGFVTDYYFKGWYKSTDTSKTILKSNEVFKASCTLYPKFEQKVNLAFNDDLDQPEVTTFEGKYVPSTTWKDVVKPSTVKGMTDQQIFVGWKGYTGSSASMQTLTDADEVESLEQDETITEWPTTKLIKPDVESKDLCHEFVFYPYGIINDGTTPTQAVTYVGNADVGILKSDSAIVIDDVLNKPLIPKVDESGTAINKGFTFNNEWKITQKDPATADDWADLSTYDPIAGGTEPQKYYLCPVLTQNIDIKYDANGGEIVEWEKEEPYTHTISIEPGVEFSGLFRPEVTPPDGKTFIGWYDSAEGGSEITPTQKFTSNTTLYAHYDTNKVGFTVNFRVADEDLNNPSTPAEPINEDNCFKVSITDLPTASHTFGDFAWPTATMPGNKLVGWYYIDEDGNKQDCTTSLPITSNADGFDVYAKFEKLSEEGYHKVTLAPWTEEMGEPQYYIDGATLLYTDHDTAPWNSLTHQWEIDGFETKTWAVGKKLTGWADKNGNVLTKISADTEDVKPIFEDADPILVTFKTGEDYTLSTSSQSQIPVNEKLINKLNVAGWAPTASKTKAQFDKWVIYNGEDTEPTPITDDYRVTGPITLMPTFIDESIFEGSSDPYYYDEDEKMWASIKSFRVDGYPELMEVYYQDGTTGYVSKETFNYEVKFGKQMTKIPDYFMFGCTNWNNGGQPLIFPKENEEISSLIEIGKDVMYGCVSFNQPITIYASNNDPDYTFKVGQNFMRGCSSFNSNITINHSAPEGIKSYANIAISDGFMLDCHNFAKTLEMTGWNGIGYLDWLGNASFTNLDEDYFYSCLASTDKNCSEFTIKCDAKLKTIFQTLFPNMNGYETSYPYRWTYRKVAFAE